MIDLNKLPKWTVSFRIPVYDDMKFSLNEIKKHWSIRKRMVDAFHEETNYALEAMEKMPKFPWRVDIIFRFFWKTRILDSSNTAFMAKSSEDALVRAGVMKTDTNECVRWICKESVLMTKKERDLLPGDELEVYICPVE